MLSNWVKATTATTGTGTLTLSAVSGYPLPADARAVGTLVQYSILASSGDKEAGIGRIAAGNTLERVAVTGTWVSGTYNGSPSAPITLPSGTHEVILGLTSASVFEPALFPLTVAEVSDRTLPSAHLRSTNANTTGLAAAQRLTTYPYLLQTSGVLTAMTINVATLAAGASCLLGLYEVGTDGAPGRRIAVTSAAIDTSTTGFKQQAVDASVRLTPGWYWTAMVASVGTASLTGAIADVHAFGASANATVASVRIDAVNTTIVDPFPASDRVISATNSPTIPYIGLVLS